MDYSQYKHAFDRDGFIVVRNFLTPDELSELNAQIQRFLSEVAPLLPETQVFYATSTTGTTAARQIHRMNCDSFFKEYQSHPKWVGLAQAMIGEAVTPRSPIYFNKPPDSDFPTPPHQDNCAFALTPPNGAEILLATHERFDEESGCLRYVPGSHKHGMRHHAYSGVRGFALEIADFGPEDESREVAVELNPGDAVCHHPLTIHRAFRNRSKTRSRTGFSMWFRGENTTIDSRRSGAYDENSRRAQRSGR
ncbi:phytanoyl-CoA dioxygenase family protein [Streptomyces rochei]|uniref:phytanoyl-CoA dioxygenase family protein n=1 Tax=Streptomyces rochei TaxID=1928 RepID=UPI0036CF82D1